MTPLNDQELGRPSDAVRQIENQDGAVLLDIRQGLCFGLTPVAARIWAYLKKRWPLDQITDSLATEFGVSREQVHDDTAQFLKQLMEQGLLVQAGGGTDCFKSRFHQLIGPVRRALQMLFHVGAKRYRFLFVKAIIALLALDFLRISTDFATIFDFVKGWAVSRYTSEEAVDASCRALTYACAWYPKRVLCLQYSAVNTCLLRSCGVAASMVLGAQILPFRAHAWVEVGGRALDEKYEISLYAIWDRC